MTTGPARRRTPLEKSSWHATEAWQISRALYWESMTLVAKLRGRLQRRSRIFAAVAVGMLLAILTLYKVTLLPPEPACARAQRRRRVHDGDGRHQASDVGRISACATTRMEALSAQTDLIGEVMVTDPVLDEIGRIAGINPLDIQATAPVTSDVPRTEIEPDSGANATPLIQAPDHYKLQVQVDPTHADHAHLHAGAQRDRRRSGWPPHRCTGLRTLSVEAEHQPVRQPRRLHRARPARRCPRWSRQPQRGQRARPAGVHHGLRGHAIRIPARGAVPVRMASRRPERARRTGELHRHDRAPVRAPAARATHERGGRPRAAVGRADESPGGARTTGRGRVAPCRG